MMVATPQALEALRFTAPQGVAGLEESYSAILERLGEDIEREGLLDTPKRAAKAMQFLTSGYTMTLDEVINGALFESDNDDMVTVRSIEFYSLCEHHLLPFFGRCHIAYLPRGKVLGLSKTARVVDYHARRLQIQENLTRQIAHTIDEVLEPRGVAVQMSAVHLCMMMRGVEKQTSDTSTSSFLGDFKTSSDLRQEFSFQVSHSTGASSRF